MPELYLPLRARQGHHKFTNFLTKTGMGDNPRSTLEEATRRRERVVKAHEARLAKHKVKEREFEIEVRRAKDLQQQVCIPRLSTTMTTATAPFIRM